ncbi:MAG: HAMP domain-containing protein [Candidatus Falkowbacteria bacterium]
MEKFKINYNSLAVKIGFFGVILIFLSLLIFSSVSLISQRNEFYNDIVTRGKIFSEFSAQSIYQDYITFYAQPDEQDFQFFKDRLEAKFATNKDIINASLISVNGRILFDSNELSSGRYTGDVVRSVSDAASLNALTNEESSYHESDFMGQKVLEYFVPIKEISGGHVLVMRYIFSFDSLNNQLFGAYREIAMSFLAVFIIMIFLCIPFYLNLSKPIAMLNDLAMKVSAGDFSVKADIKSGKDEMSDLAKNFNSMVETLRISKEETNDSHQKEIDDFKEKINRLVADNTRISRELVESGQAIVALKDKNTDLEKLNKIMIDRELRIIESKDVVNNKKNGKSKV